MNANAVLQHYRQVGVQSALDATPHRLIQMLMEAAIEKTVAAKFLMEQSNIAEKGRHISWAISIVGGLRDSLDLESGGEIAANLDALYDYMSRRLLQANLDNDVVALDEVAHLLRTVKSGWDGIAEQVN